MKIIEKRNYELQFSPAEARQLENVIGLLDDLHRTDFFKYFRDEVVGTEYAFNIGCFKDLANLLDYLLDDSTVTPLT